MANALDVSQPLKLPGQLFPFSTSVAVEGVDVFGETVRFSPAELSGTLLGAGETVTVRAALRCTATMACARCLRPVEVPLALEMDERFSRRRGEAEDEGPARAIEESRIDLTDCVRELLVLELPMRAVCSQDCKGLCPVCGADLNHVRCNCSAAQGASASGADGQETGPDHFAGEATNPFSALKAMIHSDEEV